MERDKAEEQRVGHCERWVVIPQKCRHEEIGKIETQIKPSHAQVNSGHQLSPGSIIRFRKQSFTSSIRTPRYRFHEFGDDGGPAAKEWAPKLHFVKKFVDNRMGKSNLRVDKGLGGLLFVIGSGFGAFLLISCLVLTAPMLYNFYNYDFGEPEFIRLLHEFLQCAAFVGALLFFLGMKNSVPRKKQPQKKAPKPKTA